jgi:hypothetical protein
MSAMAGGNPAVQLEEASQDAAVLNHFGVSGYTAFAGHAELGCGYR